MKSKTLCKEIMPLLLQYCNNYNMAAESNKKYYYGLLCGICDAALSAAVRIRIFRAPAIDYITRVIVEYKEKGADKSVSAETAAFCPEHMKAAADYKNQYEFINPRRWYYNARQDYTNK